MSVSNLHTFFTITQPFLGAPLLFYPALGSPEFEHLLDCYVTGSASKQDKLSQVTIDFYNNATVDLNTGALTKRYEVFNIPSWVGQSFEQSPVQSQSSGFSPPMYTPSPGSSAALGGSTYGSISLTPPSRNGAGRIAKKSKKDTKKTAEARLPGFSIMTKDGVDVTSSAGRGTKTKEQREHAHLMRQLKACADCKRKKVRCDPSHRRAHNEMLRTSTSTSTSTSKTSSSGRTNTSPAASRQATQTGIPSFSTSNAFDDFVLFPEDTTSWNYADMSLTDFEPQDLSHFNFDINDIDLDAFAPVNVYQSFDLASSLDQQPSSSMLANLDYVPFMSDQYGLDQWAEPRGYSMNINHTRPHPSGQYSDSGQANSTTDLFADIDWSSSGIRQPQSQSSVANGNLIQSSPSDWSILESSVNANISPQQGGIGTPSSQQLAQYVASRQEGLDLTVLASSRGAIPRTIVASDPSPLSSTAVLVHQSISVPGNRLSWHHMVLATLPIIAVLLATSIALDFASMTTIQQYISPLVLLTLLASGIESLRDACTQWVGNKPLISIVKIVLCATFVANAPTVLENCTRSLKRPGAESATGMAILTLLSGFNFVEFGTVSGNLAIPSTRSPEMKQRVTSSWLGMLEHLSPVTNFA